MIDPAHETVRAKMRKAEQFFMVAGAADGSAFDVAASLAVSAAINAADAILLMESGTYPQGANHGEAVGRLRGAGRREASKHLAAVLATKNKAQYSPKPCTNKDSGNAMKHAERLLDEATRLAANKGISL